MRSLPLPPYRALVAMLGVLFCVAPATIDAYLPAFDAIGSEFSVPPEAVQGTLGIYTASYAFMLLLHGRLADSFGRKSIICGSLVMYILATLLAASAPSFGWLLLARVGQGISAGASIVVGQALIRDCYQGVLAHKAMSHTLMMFNVSPALAPVIGGYLFRFLGWRSVFVFMAIIALAALLLCVARLPETLPSKKRLPFSVTSLLLSYFSLARNYRFIGSCISSSLPVGGQAFIIGAAPDLMANVFLLQPQDFGYLFVPLVIGAISGAWMSARIAGRLNEKQIIFTGQALMGMAAALTWANGLQAQCFIPGLVFTLSLFVCGLALSAPCMTLRTLDRSRSSAGAAASALGCMQIGAFALVGGWCVPLIYGRPDWLGGALLLCVAASMGAWFLLARSTP